MSVWFCVVMVTIFHTVGLCHISIKLPAQSISPEYPYTLHPQLLDGINDYYYLIILGTIQNNSDIYTSPPFSPPFPSPSFPSLPASHPYLSSATHNMSITHISFSAHFLPPIYYLHLSPSHPSSLISLFFPTNFILPLPLTPSNLPYFPP